MPAKKQKPNGFSCFMMEMRKKFEAEGRRFRNLGELTPICSPMWAVSVQSCPTRSTHRLVLFQAFSAEEKAVYNQRAKNVTAEVKTEKLDTRGVPISWKEKEEQTKQQLKMNALKEVEDIVAKFYAQGSNTILAFLFIISLLFHTFCLLTSSY